MKNNVILAAIFTLMSNYALAEIKLSDAWYRRPVPGAAVTAAYLKMTNTGKEDDRLLRVTSPLAEAHELHDVRMVDGQHEMFQIESVLVPAGKTAELAPKGKHLMLISLRPEVKHDKPATLRLEFEKAGPLVVTVMPRSPKLN